jgi:hypothetical protein
LDESLREASNLPLGRPLYVADMRHQGENMRKLIVATAALAVLVPAGLAGAKPKAPSSAANTSCKQLRKSLGATTFRQTYGTNHNRANAMGKCRSAERKALKKDGSKAKTKTRHKAIISAAKTCKAERAHDAAAFKTAYGTNANKSNAFGRCVSKHAHSRS